MFSFLNSILLPALALSAIPVIIHFFNKRKTRTVSFSSIRFLKLLESKRIKHLRIYQILLVILRTLFLISLVLAFTRPTLRQISFSDQGTATTAVIVLDNSYSMQSTGTSLSYYQKAKSYIKKILTTFNNNDKVFLVQPSSVSDSAVAVDLSYQKHINLLNPSYFSPDFNKTFARVASIFDEHVNYNQELYLISDFRLNRNLFPDSLPKMFDKSRIRFFKLNPGHEIPFQNIGIDTVTFQNQVFEQNKPFFIQVRLHNYNLEKANDTRIHVFEGQERLAMKSVHIAAGEIMDLELPIVPKQEGARKMHVELDADDLLTDNNYYLNFNIASDLNALFVGNNLPMSLDNALSTLAEESKLSIDRISFTGIRQVKLTNYDLIILYDPLAVTSDLIARLLAFAEAGHSMFIIPGEDSNPVRLNDLTNRLCNVKPFSPLKSVTSDVKYFPLQEIGNMNPLLQSTRLSDKLSLTLPQIYKFFPAQPKGEMLISLKNNFPLITSFPIKDTQGRLYLFSSSLGPSWNNLATHALFIPLLHRLMYFTGQPIGVSSRATVGQDLTLHLPRASLKDSYFIELPGGKKRPVNSLSSAGGISLAIKNIDAPGHYTVFKNNYPEHLFSVNLSSAELKGPYVNFNSIPGDLYDPENNADFVKEIKQSRTGFELWYIFLAIALLMLLLEIVLIKKIEGKFERKSA